MVATATLNSGDFERVQGTADTETLSLVVAALATKKVAVHGFYVTSLVATATIQLTTEDNTAQTPAFGMLDGHFTYEMNHRVPLCVTIDGEGLDLVAAGTGAIEFLVIWKYID